MQDTHQSMQVDLACHTGGCCIAAMVCRALLCLDLQLLLHLTKHAQFSGCSTLFVHYTWYLSQCCNDFGILPLSMLHLCPHRSFALSHPAVLLCRGVKKDDKQRDQRRRALGLHEAVTLLPESSGDAQAASFVHFGDSRAFTKNWQKKRKAVTSSSIFSPAAVAAAKYKESPMPIPRW